MTYQPLILQRLLFSASLHRIFLFVGSLAQLDRVLAFEARCCRFESCRGRQNLKEIKGFSVYPFDNTTKKGKTHVFWRIQENTSKTKTNSIFPFSRVSPKRKREMSRRKVNTKQLTAIKPIINHGKKI